MKPLWRRLAPGSALLAAIALCVPPAGAQQQTEKADMSQPEALPVEKDVAAALASYDATRQVEALQEAADAAARDDGEAVAEPDAALARARARLGSWIAILSRFRRDLDPEFDPDHPPSINIIPPGKYGDQYAPGVNPKDVKDPEMRREYIIAIEKNKERLANFGFMVKLNTAHAAARERAAASIEDAHTTLGLPAAEIASALGHADILPADRDALTAAVH
jgi:hypothetical protein